jgi:hypothetical protein
MNFKIGNSVWQIQAQSCPCVWAPRQDKSESKSARDGCEWSAPRSDLFASSERTPVPTA